MRTFLCLASAAAVLAAAPAFAADPAQARIDAYNQAIVAASGGGGTLAARTSRFETVVRTYYDMPGISALVVGPGWSSASAADKAALTSALTHHSALQLAQSFKDAASLKLATEPNVTARGADKLVRSTIGTDTLIYRMRQAGGSWKIVDVLAGGVSQLAVQRSDFAAAVSAGGAAGLTKQLQASDAKATGK